MDYSDSDRWEWEEGRVCLFFFVPIVSVVPQLYVSSFFSLKKVSSMCRDLI